jgi:hypothetical protein
MTHPLWGRRNGLVPVFKSEARPQLLAALVSDFFDDDPESEDLEPPSELELLFESDEEELEVSLLLELSLASFSRERLRVP